MNPYLTAYKKACIAGIFISIMMLTDCNSADNKPANASTDRATNKEPAKNSDWISLFNGKSLDGWHIYGKGNAGTAWKAEDSVLHLDASVKKDWQTKGGGDLVTDKEYENFDLKLEWKISEAGNSGIILYVHEDTSAYKNTWESGPEMQVCDNEKNEDGKLEKHRAGDLYDLLASTSAKVVKPAGQWNQVEIVSDKGKLDFFMNSSLVLSTTLWDSAWQKLISRSKFKNMKGFGTYKKGRIALQDHGADVWFMNIMIKEL